VTSTEKMLSLIVVSGFLFGQPGQQGQSQEKETKDNNGIPTEFFINNAGDCDADATSEIVRKNIESISTSLGVVKFAVQGADCSRVNCEKTGTDAKQSANNGAQVGLG